MSDPIHIGPASGQSVPTGKFSESTRKLLAGQAGNRCSAPWCDRTTVASSTSMKSELSNSGEAAHILGRASSSSRHDRDQPVKDREAPENGIWMCRTDATLIDRNDALYPPELLRQWKAARLAGAIEDQKSGLGRKLDALFNYETVWAEGALAELVRENISVFLNSAGVSAAWGVEVSEQLASLLFELALNARTHASAPALSVRSTALEIQVEYLESAIRFGKEELLATQSKKGGYVAAAHWGDSWDSQFLFSSHAIGGRRTWSIVDIRNGFVSAGPCSSELSYSRWSGLDPFPAPTEDCTEVRLYIAGHVSYSDFIAFGSRIDQILERAPIVVVSREESNFGIIDAVVKYTSKDWIVTKDKYSARIALRAPKPHT